MADLLTHVLVAYVLATICSWHVEWITPPLVTVAMIGAILPDLMRVELLVPAATVTAVLEVPFSWRPIHRIGGAVLLIAVCAVTVLARYRRAVIALLVLGTASHFAVDLLVYSDSGLTRPFLWPLTDQGLPAGGLYRSSERWPAIVMAVLATAVWLETRRRRRTEPGPIPRFAHDPDRRSD